MVRRCNLPQNLKMTLNFFGELFFTTPIAIPELSMYECLACWSQRRWLGSAELLRCVRSDFREPEGQSTAAREYGNQTVTSGLFAFNFHESNRHEHGNTAIGTNNIMTQQVVHHKTIHTLHQMRRASLSLASESKFEWVFTPYRNH